MLSVPVDVSVPVSPPPAPPTALPPFAAKPVTPAVRTSSARDTVQFGRSRDDEDESTLDWETSAKKFKDSLNKLEESIRKATHGVTEAEATVSSIKRRPDDEHAVTRLAGHATSELGDVNTALAAIKQEHQVLETQVKELGNAFEEDDGALGKEKKIGFFGKLFAPVVAPALFIISHMPGGKRRIYNKAIAIRDDE